MTKPDARDRAGQYHGQSDGRNAQHDAENKRISGQSGASIRAQEQREVASHNVVSEGSGNAAQITSEASQDAQSTQTRHALPNGAAQQDICNSEALDGGAVPVVVRPPNALNPTNTPLTPDEQALREPCWEPVAREASETPQNKAKHNTRAPAVRTHAPRQHRGRSYAALDLGTNNCRLLVASPTSNGFKVTDAFSRIVRLGEGIASSGALSSEAIDRSIGALEVCARKLQDNRVKRFRLIATEACRRADNGADFIDRVERETGLKLDIVDRRTEARLAVSGCATLVEQDADGVILFDIGGGSTELAFLDFRAGRCRFHAQMHRHIRAWTSLPVGVVTLSEQFGGVEVTPDVFEAMVAHVRNMLETFKARDMMAQAVASGRVHLLGTSGTVTTLAGVHLNLTRYDRRRVDGAWLGAGDVQAMMGKLLDMTYDERVANPCIGADRADLVLAGCAILEAIRREWPCGRLRVADRGLREGILVELMAADGVWRKRSKRNGRGHRRSNRHHGASSNRSQPANQTR